MKGREVTEYYHAGVVFHLIAEWIALPNNAILNFILILFIAYLLVQTFRIRNLKPQLRRIFSTIISLADELRSGLAAAVGLAPWLLPAALRPP